MNSYVGGRSRSFRWDTAIALPNAITFLPARSLPLSRVHSFQGNE